MNERKGIENRENASNDQRGEKADKSKEFGKKPAKLLVEGIIAAFTIATFSSCTPLVNSMLKKQVDENVEESDENVELNDFEEDITAEEEEFAEIVEDAEENMEEEMIEVPEEDAESEDLDVTEDEVAEIIEEEMPDMVDEEMPRVCSAFDEVKTVYITTGSMQLVGNVAIRYNGLSASSNGVYDLLCDDTVVRAGIEIAEGSTMTVDLSTEQGFTIELTANSARSYASNVTATVDAI